MEPEDEYEPHPTPAPDHAAGRYTEGVCGDGAAILYDGQPVPVEVVAERLNWIAALRAEVEALRLEHKRVEAMWGEQMSSLVAAREADQAQAEAEARAALLASPLLKSAESMIDQAWILLATGASASELANYKRNREAWLARLAWLREDGG